MPLERVLITQPMIDRLVGSTIVTLELARYLVATGRTVTVYSPTFGEPALSLFRKSGARLASVEDGSDLTANDFDTVWVHSQVLPLGLIESMRTPKGPQPSFVFLHMSPLAQIPDERPYIYLLEEKLASVTAVISEEVLDSIAPYFYETPPVVFFRNPAAPEYALAPEVDRSSGLANVLVVSNHAPDEVRAARSLLENRGVSTTHLGSGGDRYETVSPELLSKFDVVITIGKTVQYCLTSGTPVYIYDWYGGPGYLSADNFLAAKRQNFSGRSAPEKRTPEQLADDLVAGYLSAVDFHRRGRPQWIKEFSLDRVVENILSSLEPREPWCPSPQRICSLKAQMVFSQERFKATAWAHNAEAAAQRLQTELAEQRKHFEREMLDATTSLHSALEARDAALAQNQRTTSSRRFALINAALKPFDMARSLIRK